MPVCDPKKTLSSLDCGDSDRVKQTFGDARRDSRLYTQIQFPVTAMTEINEIMHVMY